MPDHPTNEIVLRANRGLVAIRLALGIAVIAAGAYFLIYLAYPEFAPWAIPGLVVISTYFLFAPQLRLLLTGTAIILTDQGLLARIGDVDFVAWDEISGARIQRWGGLKAIALDLRDPEAVLGRMSPIRRVVLRFYMKTYDGKPMLYGSFVQGGAEHLLQLIQQRLDLRHPERAGSARPLPVRPSFGTVGPKSQVGHSPTKPFARLWGYVTFVYLAAVVITIYVYSRADWGWGVPPSLAFAALALAFVSFGLLAIYAGEVSIRGGTFYRSRNPILYWFCVTMIFFIGIILFLPALIPIGH